MGFDVDMKGDATVGGQTYEGDVDVSDKGIKVDVHKKDKDTASKRDFKAYVAGRFMLELGNDHQRAGALVSVDGGAFKAEAVGEKIGSNSLETRAPGRQVFDDITIQVGTAMSPAFWKWLKASIDDNYERRSGSIVSYDFDGCERSRRSFVDALISEIQFPALDAKSKSPATITIKISPETMSWAEGDMSKGDLGDITKQKLWLPSNFRFTIDGFQDNLKWVQKIDQFTIKQNIISNPVGNENFVRKEVGRIDYPTLAFYLPETYAKPWVDIWKESVGDMKHDKLFSGAITYLASDCKTELMTLEFAGAGITNITFDKHEAQSDQIRMVKVEMFTESMTLKGERPATY